MNKQPPYQTVAIVGPVPYPNATISLPGGELGATDAEGVLRVLPEVAKAMQGAGWRAIENAELIAYTEAVNNAQYASTQARLAFRELVSALGKAKAAGHDEAELLGRLPDEIRHPLTRMLQQTGGIAEAVKAMDELGKPAEAPQASATTPAGEVAPEVAPLAEAVPPGPENGPEASAGAQAPGEGAAEGGASGEGGAGPEGEEGGEDEGEEGEEGDDEGGEDDDPEQPEQPEGGAPAAGAEAPAPKKRGRGGRRTRRPREG